MTHHDEKEAIDRAQRIIAVLGGVPSVCEITGKSRTRVYNWTYPKARGGTGGLIPPLCQIAMVEHARAKGIDLEPEHFFPPRHESAA